MDNYQKCDAYPRCTFVECECHQRALFQQYLTTKVEQSNVIITPEAILKEIKENENNI